ncbi:MAG: PTS sugar transporter subunit IIA, partial [Melioribacteraceae bacterium]|nr:PTS sugar transporter subunit IIA [Melioribacteraceae bacterium]
MKLTEILKCERIVTDFKSSTKIDILNKMIDSFLGDSRVLDIETMRNVVLEREEIMSTGVGNGFAIPHGKTNVVSEMVAGFGLVKNPIEFEALDGKPVNLIFLLVGRQDSVGQHLKMLSRISRIMNQENVREKLTNAQTSEE